jgi:transketolase
MALAGMLKGEGGKPAWRVVALLGDGELQEGQVWEVALSAPRHKVSNLTAIVDWNKAQIDGTVDEVMPLGDLRKKFDSFGWNTELVDGHDVDALRGVLAIARKDSRPTLIIADTVKGKGVSFMEKDIVGWHGKSPTKDELARALAELDAHAGGAR